MEEIKKSKIYIFVTGIIFGAVGLFGILLFFYDINVFYKKLLNEDQNYIKKTDIKSFLDKQNKVILNKDTFIIKTQLHNYLEEKNMLLIEKKKKSELDKSISSLKTKLQDKEKIIHNLNQISEKNKQIPHKIYYSQNLKALPLYFIQNTNKLDIESNNELLKLKKMKLDDSVVLHVETCINKFETYNHTLAKQRIILIKNTLKKFINPRKIRINKENIIKPVCKDPENKNMMNEDDENLVLGVAIMFNSEY